MGWMVPLADRHRRHRQVLSPRQRSSTGVPTHAFALDRTHPVGDDLAALIPVPIPALGANVIWNLATNTVPGPCPRLVEP